MQAAAGKSVHPPRWRRIEPAFQAGFLIWGTATMLSADPISPTERISLPAVVAAFLIASQISGGVFSRPISIQMASE
jgi:hypothetical protein